MSTHCCEISVDCLVIIVLATLSSYSRNLAVPESIFLDDYFIGIFSFLSSKVGCKGSRSLFFEAERLIFYLFLLSYSFSLFSMSLVECLVDRLMSKMGLDEKYD